MTPEGRKDLADFLLAEYIYRIDFIRGSIFVIGLLPLLYGISTWVFGMDLWSGSEVYNTALALPGAPQSWGSMFVSIGAGLVFCSFKRHLRVLRVAALAGALIMGMFMVTFSVEYYWRRNESAIPPALAWMIFSLMFFNLWRYASKMRTLEKVYSGDPDEHPSDP